MPCARLLFLKPARLLFGPDEKFIFWSQANNVHGFDMKKGRRLEAPVLSGEGIAALAVTKENVLIACRPACSLIFRDLATKRTKTLETDSGIVTQVEFLKSDELLALGFGGPGFQRFFLAKDRDQPEPFPFGEPDTFAVSPDGSSLAVASKNSCIYVFPLRRK
ncbi:MAG: WD40 repeat domain-containing protein [Gemmataceae bacterium]